MKVLIIRNSWFSICPSIKTLCLPTLSAFAKAYEDAMRLGSVHHGAEVGGRPVKAYAMKIVTFKDGSTGTEKHKLELGEDWMETVLDEHHALSNIHLEYSDSVTMIVETWNVVS
jgi:hypothetical protein